MADLRTNRLDLVRLSAALPVGMLLEPVVMRLMSDRAASSSTAVAPQSAPTGFVQPVASLRGAVHPTR